MRSKTYIIIPCTLTIDHDPFDKIFSRHEFSITADKEITDKKIDKHILTMCKMAIKSMRLEYTKRRK